MRALSASDLLVLGFGAGWAAACGFVVAVLRYLAVG